MSNPINYAREDILDQIMMNYEIEDLPDEILDEACAWVLKDFEYTHVHDQVFEILKFRIGDKLNAIEEGQSNAV